MKRYSHNEAVAHAFVYAGPTESGTNPNQTMWFNGDTLYSYQTPIAKKYAKSRVVVIHTTRISTTTSHQTWLVRKAFDESWTVIRCDCLDLKKIPAYIKNQLKEMMKVFPKKKDDKDVLNSVDSRILCSDYGAVCAAIGYSLPEKYDQFVKKNIVYENHRIQQVNAARLEKERKRQEELKKICEEYIQEIQKEPLFKKLQEYRHKTDQLFLEDFYKSANDLLVTFAKSKDKSTYSEEIRYVHRYLMHLFLDIDVNTNKDIYYYDLVFLSQTAPKTFNVKTDRYIDFPIAETMVNYFIKLCNMYIENPTNTELLGKHVGPYTIRGCNDDHIKVGCHIFHKNQIILFLKELEYAKKCMEDKNA